MAGRIAPAVKAELQRTDKWQPFLERRAELVAQGMKAEAAKNQAIDELLGPQSPAPKPIALASPPRFAAARQEPAENPKPAPAPAVVGHASDAGLPSDVERMLAERKAGAREVVEWVFENLYNGHPDPGNAPSLGAWGYLQSCKGNREVRTDFLKNVWPRLLPSRAQLDDEERFKDDGRDLRLLAQELLAESAGDAPEPGAAQGV